MDLRMCRIHAVPLRIRDRGGGGPAQEVLCCPEKSHPQENKEKELLGYGSACDVWAVGVLAVELVTGHPPFERESRADTYECIMYRSPDLGSLAMSQAAQDFVAAALTKARLPAACARAHACPATLPRLCNPCRACSRCVGHQHVIRLQHRM